MKAHRRSLLLCGAAAGLWVLIPSGARAAVPALMLAEGYRAGMPLDGYWVSEKYDGLRSYWDGKQLWTRGGERIAAPAWFTAPLPATPMDGELWAGRGRFELTLSTVRAALPDGKAWREIRFMVFDLPAQGGDFDARLGALRKSLPLQAAPWVVAVPQERATTHAALMALLDKTVRLGGEGLVLHRGASLYRAQRSTDLLKLKPVEDAEASVVAHLPGKGRHTGRMGALLVRSPEGLRFRIGTGFTDAQRHAPPPVGSTITYSFNGVSASGVPRSARFVRVRSDG